MKKGTDINEGIGYSGFKLISFELEENKLFGNIKYDFIDTDDKQDKIYTTVLIGQNGTLKSRLFQKIILTFWGLHDLINEKKTTFSDRFYLKYALNNSIYEFGNIDKESEFRTIPFSYQPYLQIDGEEKIYDYKKANLPASILPLSIIAIAIMITDRFPFPDPKKFNIYQYLGSRYRPQLASTKAFIGRVVEFISKNIDSEAFINGVRKIVNEFLHNSNQPCITFHTQNTPRFFKGEMNVEDFFSYYENIDVKYKENPQAAPFKLNHYKGTVKKDPKLAQEIVDYCNALKKNGDLRGFPKSSAKAISFNLLNENDVAKLRKEFFLLDHMRQLGIVYPADIEFLKSVKENDIEKLEGYSIIDSSSGEYNLLGSMIGIIASIQTNSLIFIDEPEISLHPNWQMKYLSFLRELLSNKEYSTCHIIVATHSHFLVSDLVGINSSVVVLSRETETNKLSAELLKGQDTYCWSPDDILYNVFDVTSSRNKFVAEDIANILDTLSKGTKGGINKIEKEAYETLIHLKETLKDNDPLKEVVKSILKKVN